MRELGHLFKSILGSRRNMCFVIQEQYREFDVAQVMITPDTIEGMIQNCTFKMSVVSITVSNRLASSEVFLEFGPNEMYPISGFPRVLHQQENRKSISQSSYQFKLKQANNQRHRQPPFHQQRHQPMGWSNGKPKIP